jgi:hypothetical protein
LRRALAALPIAGAIFAFSTRAANAPGFVPYDPVSEGQVSGALLMIAAYGAICGILGLYALSLFLRSRALAVRTRRLQERVSPGGHRDGGSGK